MNLDEARARFPHLGFAVFAMEPGGAVTLEAYGPGGELWRWEGVSEADVLAQAFPPAVSQTPPGAGSAPALRPTHETTQAGVEAGGVAETAGVFG